MRFLFLCILLLNAAIAYPAAGREKFPGAVRGVLDLRKAADPDKFITELNGEWEFYWKEMLRPDDFRKREDMPAPYYGKVPSYWTDYPQKEVSTGPFGYATYRITVLLPHGIRNSLGIDLPVFDSSYEIFINGKSYGGNGHPGKSAEETTPGYRKNIFTFIPLTDSLEIIINVSNYHHRRGGFWLPARFGTFSLIRKEMAHSWFMDLSSMSLLFGFSVFFLFFFLLYPKEKVLGFFSMASVGLALRPLFTSNYIILGLADPGWTWLVRFEYLSLFLVIIGSAWFVNTIYPSELYKAYAWTVSIIFSLFAVLTLFLPVTVFSYSTLMIYPSLLVVIFYSLYSSFRGILRKNTIDIVYFLAFVLILYGGIHDMAMALGRAFRVSNYIMTYIVVIFVFIQAILLMLRSARTYKERMRLQDELEYMNRNLEIMVKERTLELQKRSDEIEKQNIMIAEQNRKLSDTIQLKNKIFSVISHDLRGPVVNILYLLNLLKEKEFREHYDSFADSSIEYAQNVINLLENILVWGRGQEGRIRFAPARYDLRDIINTNLGIFKEIARRKEISISFSQEGRSFAFIDKDLLDIIMRNLLSNAVKYTNRGGSINITVKGENRPGEGVLLRICDNGIGIPQDKLRDLFNSAEISSTPGTENEPGTGLGLKLCYELVKLNNGTIMVESTVGEGSCFGLALPGA